MSTRLAIAAVIYLMVNAVLFGVGTVTVLSVPALDANATVLMPLVIIGSFILALPLSWAIAPRLRLRYWDDKNHVA